MIDLSVIPHKPGCYLYKNSKDRIIYVGKAKDLRKRVASYFQKNDHDTKTEALVAEIRDVDLMVTNTEVEALVLENNLIKKHQPRYNINLKDSKRYAYLKLTDESFPKLILARNKKGRGEYFGPFVSGQERNYVKEFVVKTFKLRTCKRMPKRECLRYHINLCQAPCIGNISKEDYAEKVKQASKVMRGHIKEVIVALEEQMKDAAKDQEFERAKIYRNRMNALTYLQEKQNVERNKVHDEDIVNYEIRDGYVYLILFNIYKGVLSTKHMFNFEFSEKFFEEFLVQYYSDNPVPKELILPEDVDKSLIEFLENQFLEQSEANKKKGRKFFVTVPKIGEKKQLLELVKKNIEVSFFADISRVEDLKKQLRLPELPRVIECFDISHLSGTSTVGSMVQFRNGKPDKGNYRRFKVRTVEGIDDFASLNEVVKRRYSRLQREGLPMPDLVVIDGGKGQLSSTVSALRSIGLSLPIISLAKRLEEVFVPGTSLPLGVKGEGLKLLQQLRDEAHRFAITYNRLLRSRKVKDAFKDL